MILRPYQQTAIDSLLSKIAVERHNKVLLCAPTGAGKTVIFSEITRRANDKKKRILILTHRNQLMSQAFDSISRFGIEISKLTASDKILPKSNIVIAMIETIKRRLKKDDYKALIRSFDLVIIDECHLSNFNRLFDVFLDNQIVIGVSATPFRDGSMQPLSNYYQSLITVCQIKELINDKFLSNPKYYGMPIDLSNVKVTGGDYNDGDLGRLYQDRQLFSGAVDNYLTHTPNSKAIVFCATIANSKSICDEFNDKGVKCEHFDCYMSDDEKESVLKRYYNNEFKVLCNVGILTTGFDCPDIETIILYRATKSLPLFLQMVGRGSRVTEFKKSFTILDFGNNCIEHGFWHDDRQWSLDKKEKKKRGKKDVAPVKFCPECGAILPANARECEFCGYVYPSKEKEREYKILQIIDDKRKESIFLSDEETTIEDLITFAELKKYNQRWVWYQLKTLKQFIEYGKLKGYKNGWAFRQFSERSQASI